MKKLDGGAQRTVWGNQGSSRSNFANQSAFSFFDDMHNMKLLRLVCHTAAFQEIRNRDTTVATPKSDEGG